MRSACYKAKPQANSFGKFEVEKQLKSDAFGCIEIGHWVNAQGHTPAIRRKYTKVAWLRPIALILANNEKRALRKLGALASAGQVPQLLAVDPDFHIRSFIDAEVLYRMDKQAMPRQFYQDGMELIRKMRRYGVCNNDLAKQANWLVRTSDGKPVLVDFQLALCFKDIHNKLFLTLCREDLRHILKHKRDYYPVSASERKILNKKSLPTRIWMATGKKVYLFWTRKVLGWKDRTGPYERDF